MLQGWTRDRDLFRVALGRANEQPLRSSDVPRSNATGRTLNTGSAVFDAVATALAFAATGAHGKKVLLVISDGNDISSRRSARDVQEAIRASEVLVYALGVEGGLAMSRFGPTYASVNASALRRLTDDTGGRTEVVKGFTKLAESTARLADEFNRQYVIGYAAPAGRDGRWHSIKVEVRKRGANVRARAGYVASKRD
jgi:VWFA-related protein